MLDIRGPHIGVFVESIGDRAAAVRRAELQNTRIVGIQHSHAVARQRFHQLALCTGNSLNGFEAFDVRVPDGGDHSNARARDFREIPNLSRVVHPDLENCHCGRVGNRQHGQREAYMIIEVPGGLADTHSGGEQRGNGVLGGRLTGASGDSDHLAAPT